MLTKVKALSTAIAAASAMIASSAFALTGTETPDLHIYLGGASAQDVLIAGLLPTLCTDTAAVFSDTTGTFPGSDQNAYFCTMSAATVSGTFNGSAFALSGTKKVMIHKRSAGGSAYGVAPVALASLSGFSGASVDIPFMEISFGSGNGTAGNNCAVDGSTFTDGLNHWKCNKTVTATKIVDVGISDVEPAMFTGPNLIPVDPAYGTVAGDAGTAALTVAQLNRMDIEPMAAVTFGVVVTKDLRDALQRAQGKTAGSDDVAQMPSLTSTQIRSIFTGALATWDQFTALKPGGNSLNPSDYLPLTDAAFNSTNTLADTHINICRRDPGSGTQAQFNARFLDAPASDLVPYADNSFTSLHTKDGSGHVLADSSAASDASPGLPLVHELTASGDLTQCLVELQTVPNLGGVATNGGNYWGIGIQGVTSANSAFRFVAVDGVAPTLNNVASGKYHDWAINTLQWRKTSDFSNSADGTDRGVLAGDKLAIAKKLVLEASSPALLDSKVNKANANITGTGTTKVGALALSFKKDSAGHNYAPGSRAVGASATTPYVAPFAPYQYVNASSVTIQANPVLPIAQKGFDYSKGQSTIRPATLDGTNVDINSSNMIQEVIAPASTF